MTEITKRESSKPYNNIKDKTVRVSNSSFEIETLTNSNNLKLNSEETKFKHAKNQ